MKIAHVTTVHSRKDIRIFHKECISLAKIFPSVVLLVGDGIGDEYVSGVSIVDVGVGPRSRTRRAVTQTWKMYRYIKRSKFDIVHIHDPELLLMAKALVRIGVKVIYDSHEDVPRQILSKSWIPRHMRRLIAWGFERFENFTVSHLYGIVTATPHIADRFRKINPRTIDINNFPLPNELAPLSGSNLKKRQVCYVGGITRIRGLGPLVEAINLVDDIKLILCGKFAEPHFEAELRNLPGWRYVDYRGQVDRGELQKIMGESIAGIVTFLPLPNHINAQPNKMFEYMSAELPVIASDFPLWSEIIDGTDAGICVDPTSPEAIAAAIHRLLEDPLLVERKGRAGREAILNRYNWPAEAKKLQAFYKELM
jgi:glycosyltransferase involved in cell wall biosynthesis